MSRNLSIALAAAALLFTTIATARAERAEIGKPAPQFVATDAQGNTYNLADLNKEGKIVVLEWFNPGCPFVVRHYKANTMNELVKKYGEQNVVWLAVSSTHNMSAEDVTKAATKWNMNHPILMDPSGQLGHLYGAKTTPDMFIINKDGVLVYSGAIDNNPRGDKSKEAVNYVDQALTELLAGKAVSMPETRPYGCSVKYGKPQANAATPASATRIACDGDEQPTEKPKDKDKDQGTA